MNLPVRQLCLPRIEQSRLLDLNHADGLNRGHEVLAREHPAVDAAAGLECCYV